MINISTKKCAKITFPVSFVVSMEISKRCYFLKMEERDKQRDKVINTSLRKLSISQQAGKREGKHSLIEIHELLQALVKDIIQEA